ncbi:MAG: hypothetical protein AAGA12_12930 [Pseudomonadota bacterium]
MDFRHRCSAALIACTLVFPTQLVAQEISRTVPIDDGFANADVSFTGGVAGGYEARWKVIQVNGIIEVCGAGAFTNIQLRDGVKRGLKRGQIYMNGKVILEDLSFFADAKRASKLKATPANCRSTGVKVTPQSTNFSLRYGKMTVRN